MAGIGLTLTDFGRFFTLVDWASLLMAPTSAVVALHILLRFAKVYRDELTVVSGALLGLGSVTTTFLIARFMTTFPSALQVTPDVFPVLEFWRSPTPLGWAALLCTLVGGWAGHFKPRPPEGE